jgi:hypothetical protein
MVPGRWSTAGGFFWAAALLLAGPGCTIDRGGSYFPDGWSPDAGHEESEAAVEIEDEASPDLPLPDDGDGPDPGEDPGADPVEADPGETCATVGPAFYEDGLTCTEDTCRDATGGPVCDRVVSAGACLVGGACLAAGQEEAGNSCRLCDPAVSNVDWTQKPDSTACAGGICCGGVCRPGGQCCVDWDCDGCDGTPDPCSSIFTETDCSPHGCDWVVEGTCTGGYGCSNWDYDMVGCAACGCTFGGGDKCRGDVPCSSHGTSATCAAFGACGCSWAPAGGSCTGTPDPCSVATLPSWCSERPGCAWVTTATCNTSSFVCEP